MGERREGRESKAEKASSAKRKGLADREKERRSLWLEQGRYQGDVTGVEIYKV